VDLGVELEGCRRAHERLAVEVAQLSDADARRPSLLPDWTVGHVLTHLARNAEAMHRRVEAAARDELVDQYPGGTVGRAAAIEAGAGRPASELAEDVTGWAGRLDDLFASVPDDCWARPVRTHRGDTHPAGMLPFRRWREVEVHLVDLGVGVTPADWSPGFVERAMPRLLAGLAGRADERALMGWCWRLDGYTSAGPR
jgi:maleylpyruvate isomerase